MEKNNQRLQVVVVNFQNEIKNLKSENKKLIERIEFLETPKPSISQNQNDQELPELIRISKNVDSKTSPNLNKSSMLHLLAITCMLILPNESSISTFLDKTDGVLPLIGKSLPVPNKQFKTTKEMCHNYCKKKALVNNQNGDEIEKNLKKNNRTQTSDCHAKISQQVKSIIKINSLNLVCFDEKKMTKLKL